MKVTVLIAAYNAEKYIAEAIASALGQSVPSRDREVLVVNDGSTDQTLPILRSFGGAITILDEPQRGLAGACNTGLAAARGEYFLRLDADDILDREALAIMSSCLDADPDASCVYSDRVEIFPDGEQRPVSMAAFNIFKTIASGMLFRTDLARAVGGYDDLLFEEYDFLIRYLKVNPKRLHVPKPLYVYRRHGSGITGQPEYWQQGWRQIIRKWGEAELARWNYRDVYQPQ